METEQDPEVQTKETQDYASPKVVENMIEKHEQEEMITESADVSMGDDAKCDVGAEDLDMQSKEDSSPNISSSSDLISGTPQKPNSRRQSFITLEKYADGKPASPSSVSTFTGPLIKNSNSQERSYPKKTSSSQADWTSTCSNSQDSHSTQTAKTNLQGPVNQAPESPIRPKDSGMKCGPIRLTERMPSAATEEEDVIPDTQTEVEGMKSTKVSSTLEELKPSSQEEESDQTLDDSQLSESQTSSGEPRRSGRRRIRPQLPGEDPKEREEKYTHLKRRRSGEEPKNDSPESSQMQSRPNTRSKQAAEEDSGRLRTRAQRDKSESSQTNSQGRAHKKIKLYSSSQDLLDKPEAKRRSTRESSQTDLLSDSQSDYESQSQGRHGRRRKSSLQTKEEGERKEEILPDKEEPSQTATHEHELTEQAKKDDKPKKDSQVVMPSLQASSKSPESELVNQTNKDDDKSKDSQIVTSSPQTGGQSQELEFTDVKEDPRGRNTEKTKKETDSQIVTSPNNESQDGTSTTNKWVNESEVKDKPKTVEETDYNLSQENSQVITPSSSNSQSLRRSRRSKASSEAAESEDKSKNNDFSGRRSRSNSQPALSTASHVEPEATSGGRTRRSKVQEEQSKSSSCSTPESSRSLNIAGSTESSQGRGRYSRRSSQALVANMESSQSESSEARENSLMPKKGGRKPRSSLQSPVTLESKDNINNDLVKNNCDNSQQADTQSKEAINVIDIVDSQETQDLHTLPIVDLSKCSLTLLWKSLSQNLRKL